MADKHLNNLGGGKIQLYNYILIVFIYIKSGWYVRSC